MNRTAVALLLVAVLGCSKKDAAQKLVLTGSSTVAPLAAEIGKRFESLHPGGHVVIGDNQQGIKTVAGNPDSIGYVSIGTAEYEAGHGSAIKLLPCSGVAASIENVKNKSFPLSRPLNLVTKTAPAGLAREFIDF